MWMGFHRRTTIFHQNAVLINPIVNAESGNKNCSGSVIYNQHVTPCNALWPFGHYKSFHSHKKRYLHCRLWRQHARLTHIRHMVLHGISANHSTNWTEWDNNELFRHFRNYLRLNSRFTSDNSEKWNGTTYGRSQRQKRTYSTIHAIIIITAVDFRSNRSARKRSTELK